MKKLKKLLDHQADREAFKIRHMKLILIILALLSIVTFGLSYL